MGTRRESHTFRVIVTGRSATIEDCERERKKDYRTVGVLEMKS
jgi:hypothetical protein